jgi:hypothetical protein
MVRRFFCFRGIYQKDYNWALLYKAIYDFKLIFRFKYNLLSQTITADYVPAQYRWLNQMRFFRFYLKLLKRFKWHELPQKQLFGYINKAKRSCYLGLLRNKKKSKVECF